MKKMYFNHGQQVYSELTEEEIEEVRKQATEMPPPEPTQEERISALEGLTDDIVLFMADIIGG